MSQSINIYSPRMLLGALQQLPPVKRFFMKNLFKKVITFETEKVDVDIVKGGREVAAVVHPMDNGNLVEGSAYDTFTVAPAYVKEYMPIRPNDTVTRLPGEDYSQPLSAKDREQRLLGEKLVKLETRTARLEELMASQALIHGKVKVKGKKNEKTGKRPEFIVDFGYEDGVHRKVLSGEACWDKSADIMFDLDKFTREISTRSGMKPSICLLGEDVLKHVIDNPKLQARLDIRRFNGGELGLVAGNALPVDFSDEDGVSYHGTLYPSNVHLFTYDELIYNEDTQKDEPLVPKDAIWLSQQDVGLIYVYRCMKIN